MKQNADSLRTITSISLHLLWGKRERQRERETETERVGENEHKLPVPGMKTVILLQVP